MLQSESISKLVKSLAACQRKFTPVPKNKTGQSGNIKFKYSDLADVLNMITPILSDQGIFLNQPIVTDETGNQKIVTRVQLDEEFMQTDGIRLSPNQFPGQRLGAEVTYGRRIDLNSFIGISPDDDLDAPDIKQGQGSEIQNTPKIPVSGKPQVNQTPAKPTQQRSNVQSTASQNLINEKTDIIGNIQKLAESSETRVNPEITSDDLPNFDTPLKDRKDWPVDAPEDIFTFTPLTAERNTEIQNKLKELVANKTLPARSFTKFLELRHEGKRSFDVSASQWEDTYKLVLDTVQEGEQAIKVLLGQIKA